MSRRRERFSKTGAGEGLAGCVSAIQINCTMACAELCA
jgi:hypothetical protein